MEPVDVNESVHTAHKQHRVCGPICARASSVDLVLPWAIWDNFCARDSVNSVQTARKRPHRNVWTVCIFQNANPNISIFLHFQNGACVCKEDSIPTYEAYSVHQTNLYTQSHRKLTRYKWQGNVSRTVRHVGCLGGDKRRFPARRGSIFLVRKGPCRKIWSQEMPSSILLFPPNVYPSQVSCWKLHCSYEEKSNYAQVRAPCFRFCQAAPIWRLL